MKPVEHKDIKFEVTHALQRSLDLKETLNSFFRAVQAQVPCGGMKYTFPGKRIDFHFGAEKRHSAQYSLKIKDQSLGQLVLQRHKPFTESELTDLESLISLLILPLRNALLYRDALENSLRDSLTQVGNRAAFELAIQREFQLCRRNGAYFSLLIIDMDHFKRINDARGHSVGDMTLQFVSALIRNTLRQTDQVFRYGGEEFLVILGSTAHAEALVISDRLRTTLASQAFEHDREPVRITVSIGVGTSRDTDSRDSLFQRTDAALYQAKALGRNCVVSAENQSPPERAPTRILVGEKN